MAKIYVPVDTVMPSRWRIIQRDSLARGAVVFCLLGLVASALYVVTAIRPTPPPHSFADDLPRYGPVAARPAPESPIGPAWLIVGLGCAALLPLRVMSVRRLFRRGTEVTGRVEKQYRRRRWTVITYAYSFEGASYTGKYPMELSTALAFNASVAVVVDPRKPARSILKHAFVLEAVDPVPRARIQR